MTSAKILLFWLFQNCAGDWDESDQSIKWHHHMKDQVKSSHLTTKFDVLGVNRDQVMDIEAWFKIHTSYSKMAAILVFFCLLAN